jgi:hypothetical protein
MKNSKKYDYYKIIQQYCNGWYDASHYKTDSSFNMNKENRELLKHDLKEYRLCGYPIRVISRKELKELA